MQAQSTLIAALLTESQEVVFEVLLGLSFSFQVSTINFITMVTIDVHYLGSVCIMVAMVSVTSRRFLT